MLKIIPFSRSSAILWLCSVNLILASSEYHEQFREAIRTKDKSALKKQYPQLNFKDDT